MVEIFDHNCPLCEFDPSLQRTAEAAGGWCKQVCCRTAAVYPLQVVIIETGQTPDRRGDLLDQLARSQEPGACIFLMNAANTAQLHSLHAPAGLQAAGCIKTLHAAIHASPIQ